MADIASLGIQVTTQGAKEAAADLTKLAAASKQAATGVQTASDAAKKAGGSFKSTAIREQREELSKLLGQIDPTVAALGRLDAMEQRLGKFRKRGLVDTDTFNDASKKINDSRTALTNFGNSAGKAGKSAKELAFATRGLPAQFTDIAVSLQAGQRPLSVLLQQGGQLKDIFGGVGPALRAMGGYILSLINPITLTVAAVAALGFAWKESEDRSNGFNRALALTGLNADITAEKLAGMAGQLDNTTNVTAGKASEVLSQVAATGKFTADQIDLVARAAINLEDATGRSIQQTVKDFASLKGDPVSAILALNDAMGDGTNVTHFLTQETINQIEKLKEQGREADATALAMKAYADGINTRTPQVVQNLGFFATAWRNISKAARETGDEAVTAIGKMDRALLETLPTLQKVLLALPGGFVTAPLLGALGAGAAAPKGRPNAGGSGGATGTTGNGPLVDSEAERRAIEFKDRYLTKEENKKKAIAELDRLRSHYTAEEYKILKAGIEERFKQPKGANPARGIEGAQNRAALQAFQDQLKVEQDAITNSTRVLEAQYAARTITAEKYYSEQKRLSQEGTRVQEAALVGQIGVLKARNVSGKDGIDTIRELKELEAQLAKVRADGATQIQILGIQEAATAKQRLLAAQAYKTALDESADAIQAQMQSSIDRISMGEREFEIQSQINKLYRDQAKELLALARQRDAGEIDAATYAERVEQLRTATEAEVAIVRDGYKQMAEAQADWKNGAIKAFKDYADKAADVAGQTYAIFNNAFSGLEDVAVDFFTKGKADWKGYLDSVAADITRFVVRQQLSKLFKKFMPGGESGDQASALSGAAGQLAASAAPLLGAAAALSASAAALAAAGAGSAATGAGGFSSFLDAFSGGGGGEQWYANGGAFSGGVQKFATGGVFDSPTMFGMAGGRMGVMGEAGPEAILPLHRGPDGKLGVRAAANDDGHKRGDTYIQTSFVLPSTMTPQTQAQIAQGQQRVATRATGRNR